MSRPNFLLITSDQQHYSTIGAFNPELRTPNLDRLVREGMTFTRAYCPNPTCTPTRSSIITGQYPSQHGAWTLGTKLPEDSLTVGGELLDAGYRTALVGKAHFQPLGQTEEFPSLESRAKVHDYEFWRSFSEVYYGFQQVELSRGHTNEAAVGQHYVLWLEEQGCANWRDYFVAPTGTMDAEARHQWPIPERYHYNAWIAERTNALLEQYKSEGETFFLWASFFDPHPKYLAPEPWDRMYDPQAVNVPGLYPGEHDRNPPHFALTQQKQPDFGAYRESGFFSAGHRTHVHDPEKLRKDIAVYYGMISLMDKYIGRILDRLEELGLAENTVVVFTSDHGHVYGHHGLTSKGPFHYEDLLRVPFIVRYPGRVPAGATSDSLQSLVDLAPTFLSIAGLSVPGRMTGIDQSSVWNGKQAALRDHVICENHQEPTVMNLRTYVNERYKLTVYFNRTYGELFDLWKDPGEVHNLWDDPEHLEVKQELMMRYIWAELGKEPLWMPRISGA